MNMMMTSSKAPVPRSYAPYWLAVLPLLAVVGSMITLYLALRYPDQVVPTEVQPQLSTQEHVINSVTPPLR